MTWILAYLATGAVIGFLAGLLGIGGGMTLVPVLAALFAAQQFAPAHVMHLALGTAMASIVFTASSSVREHHRLGSVDWAIVRRLAPPMTAGTLLATLGSGWVPQRALALAFAAIVVAAATQIWIGRKPAAGAQGLPGPAALWGVGGAIGLVCGLVSAGGAFMTMPFLLWRGVPVRTAIGTGAALGLPVALLGTAGYVAAGQAAAGLPPGCRRARWASCCCPRCCRWWRPACCWRPTAPGLRTGCRWPRCARSSPPCCTCWPPRWPGPTPEAR